MGTSFIPFCAIIAVLIIAFLFASLLQVSHKMRYRVLYAIAIIMLFAIIPISDYMSCHANNSNNNYLLVLMKAILVCACAFAGHGMIITPSTTIQLKDTCSQQDLMNFVCSTFFNMGKKRNDIVSFLSQVFSLCFPVGKSDFAKKMRGL